MASHVSYGQFGRATYSDDQKAWSFIRNGGRLGVASILDDATELLKPSLDHGDPKASTDPTALIKRFPELQPAPSELLHELATESLATEELPASRNEKKQNLALGSIAYAKGELASRLSGYAVPAIAIPGGRSGEILRVIRVEYKQRRFGDRAANDVELLSLSDEVGYWVGGVEPILQTVFAEVIKNRGSLLAIRLRSQTQLFRPLWHQTRKPPVGAYPGCPYPSSRIEVNPLVALTAAQTGGAAHADVCFDSRDQRKFAVVDIAGRWSLFQLAGRHSKSHVMYHLISIAQGHSIPSFLTFQGTRDGELSPARDGSSAIADRAVSEEDPGLALSWFRCILLEHGILIAGPMTLRLFRFEERLPILELSPSDLHAGYAEFRDVVRIGASRSEVGILTSRRIMHIRLKLEDGEVRHDTAMSWPHYRSQDDDDLELCCHWSPKSHLHMLVYSSQSTICNLFSARFNDIDHSMVMLDPVCYHVPLRTAMVSMQQPSVRTPNDAPSIYSIMSLLLLSNDLSMNVQHYLLTDKQSDMSMAAVRLTKPRIKAARSFLSDALVLQEDFIALDEVGSEEPLRGFNLTTSSSSWKAVWQPRSSLASSQAGLRTLNHHWTYQRMAEDIQRTQDSTTLNQDSQDRHWRNLLDTIRSIEGEEGRNYGTLLDISQEPFRASDTDKLSRRLHDLFQSPSNVKLARLSMAFESISQSASDEVHTANEATKVTALYDGVVNRWIVDVPSSTPVQTRKFLSRLASQVASEVALARVLVRPPTKDVQPTEETMASRTMDENDMTSRAESRSNDNNQSPSFSGLHTSLPDEAPDSLSLTPELTPSIMSGSSYASQAPNPGDLAYERLSTLVEFDEQPRQLLPRIRRVLDHWSLGEDPDGYDWTQTRHTLEAKGERTLNKRAERKARRHLERQRKEAARAMRDVMRRPPASQPMPRILPIRSSPTLPTMSHSTQPVINIGFESSQAQPEPAVVASQVSRGRHGARPRAPPLKKRRQGF